MAISKLEENLKNIQGILDLNLIPENIKKDIEILGVVGTLETGGSNNFVITDDLKFSTSKFSTFPSSLINADWSQLSDASSMFESCEYLTIVPSLNTSNVTRMEGTFINCTSLTTISQLDTSNVMGMGYMFSGCNSLTTIPILNTSNVTEMSDMFLDCSELTDTSLDNILSMCINATNIDMSERTLQYIGLSEEQAETCTTLSNWQTAESAGWSTGY